MGLSFNERRGPDGAGDLVVLLHGFGGCALQWRGLQRDLSTSAHSIACDLPGHAGSLFADVKSTPKAAAQAILGDVQHRVERVHVVGHSMGGAVASLMAILEPARIASLTLLAPGGFGPEIAHGTLKTWATAESPDEIASVMPSFFGANYNIDPKIIDLHVGLRNKDGAVQKLEEIAQNLAKDGVQGELPLESLWATHVPISVIWGTDDRILSSRQATALESLHDSGRIELHIVEGMGHSPAEEAPKLVRDTVFSHVKSANQ